MLFRAFVSSLVIVILILGTIFFEKKKQCMHPTINKWIHMFWKMCLHLFFGTKRFKDKQ